MAELDGALIRHALSVARRHGFVEVELETEEGAFSASLDPQPRTAAPSPHAPTPIGDAEPALLAVKAAQVGYFREAPTPLAVGVTIAKGTIVGIIAALGIANDIESTVDGEVVEILVEPGQPVEYGQVIAWVKP